MGLDFPKATLEGILQMVLPVGDALSGGKASDGLDEIGDRARAGAIVAEETAETLHAVADAAQQGIPTGSIQRIVDESKDVAQAKRLLADPSLIVELDGEATTADDDVDPNAPALGEGGG